MLSWVFRAVRRNHWTFPSSWTKPVNMETTASATTEAAGRKTCSRFLLPFLAILLPGCASVSVFETRSQQFAELPPALPSRIYVQNFETPSDRIFAGRSGASLERFEYGLAEMLNRHLVWRISEEIAPAQGVAMTAPLPPGNAWLVTGSFDRVEQGSRLLRFLPGFGAGATHLQTTTRVYDLRNRQAGPILEIRTLGGSNLMPAWIAPQEGLTRDVNRTAREINRAMQEYLFNQQLRTRKRTDFPKYNGRWP